MTAGRIETKVHTGRVLVGGDGHIWPGRATTAHRAFVAIAREFQPQEIIYNGDVVDGATVSRHPPIGWESAPTLAEEIEAATERLWEITDASPKAKLRWPLGNHDARFETKIASVAPEYENVKGVHLRDHFPDWDPCWAVMINGRQVMVTHRFKGGLYAARNNVIATGGMTVVSGHTHRLGVTPVTFDGQTAWGVESGMLADPLGPQFTGYTESNPTDWRAGCVLLTFDRGRLLWPEVMSVVDEKKGLVDWRGTQLTV